MKPCILVMGICGTGKTTVGRLLSNQLDIPFIEADDFHSEANILKMKKGHPLNDDDRQPWLEDLAKEIKKNEPTGCVLACSALKEKYRKTLNSLITSDLVVLHLIGDSELIAKRMTARTDHFMPTDLIKSQLADLEEPENAFVFDIANEPKLIVDELLEQINFSSSS